MPSISHYPVDIDVDWRAVEQLLQAGEYDQILGLLELSRLDGADVAHPPFMVALAAFRQLCLACRQSQADHEWHRQALWEAERRELLWRENAQTLLDWIATERLRIADRSPPPAIPLPVAPIATPPPTPRTRPLSKLLQSLFGLFTSPPAAPPLPTEQTLISVTVPTQPPSSPAMPAMVQPDVVAPPASEPDHSAATADSQSERSPLTNPYTLTVYYFGPFRVYQHDQPIEEWNGLKGQAILKYLLAQNGALVAKDVLMDLFWVDVEPEAARRNLHQAIYSLRQTLRRRDPDVQYILFENNQYSLNPELSLWLDVEEFEAQIRNGRRLEVAGQLAEAMHRYTAAVNLYQGDFLADDLYEDWPRPRRHQLRLAFLEIANRLSAHHFAQAEYTAASALCQRILALDNCHEEAHRHLMQIYLAQGQRHLALRQYQHCTQALAEELDVPPAAETTALYESITART